ncbi:hypothetical protein F2P79_003762 [Pimephales promelas]|nr:hypothetical protein F2P79_003762 [Pimephales promelas]
MALWLCPTKESKHIEMLKSLLRRHIHSISEQERRRDVAGSHSLAEEEGGGVKGEFPSAFFPSAAWKTLEGHRPWPHFSMNRSTGTP